jgi:hypothetical protein
MCWGGFQVVQKDNLALRIAEGLETVNRHIRSEYTSHVPTIMETISAKPRYALVSGQTGRPLLTVLNGREEVADYYSWTHESNHEPIATRHPKHIATDWYVFYEALPSQRPIGQSEIVLTNYALLFPYADDGMIGEILWKRSVFGEPGSFEDEDITISSPFAAGDVRALRLYESFARAVAESDIKHLDSLVADGAEAALPDQSYNDGRLDVVSGHEGVVDWFIRLGRDAEILQSVSLNLIATSWYVFDERMMLLRANRQGLFGYPSGHELIVRLACIYKLDESGTAFEGIVGIAKVDA